jgi:NHL repeat
VAGVAVDQEDRVFLIWRGENPVIVYDRRGNLMRTWGTGDFSMRTHGIRVAPNGTIFATDDGNHTVRQFTPAGRLSRPRGI